MHITTDSPQEERSSPFFKANEEFCMIIERYITNKKGKVKGKYTAWAYIILGEITTPDNWTLFYKKSTLSSGNLLLSSKYQNLLRLVEWTKKDIGKTQPTFLIRKRKIVDYLRIKLNPNLSYLEVSPKYVIKSKEIPSPQLLEIIVILKVLFLSKEVYQVKQEEGILKIELRTAKHHFELLDRLLKIEY